jgi:Ca2+:H+ antiporter
LGSGFLLAGYGLLGVSFAQKATSVMESLMMVTSVALIIPTAVSSSFVQPEQTDTRDHDALILSRGTAVVLIILFVQYLYFHLGSHSYLFSDGENGSRRQFPAHAPSRCTAVTILISCILAVAACANYLVRSIPAFSKATGLSQTFVSIIIIPFAGNALKWANLMTLFRENANVATKLVIASVLQISLLVLPLLVLIGWMAGQTMTLDFDEFEASLLLLAIIVVNGIVQDGKATYFEGAMLMGTYVDALPSLPNHVANFHARYVVVSVAFYVRPEI